MIKINENPNVINDKIFSIFNNENIPQKIVYNSFVNNNTPFRLKTKSNNITKDKKQISIFNPYDTEIDYNLNGNKLSKFNYDNERNIYTDNDICAHNIIFSEKIEEKNDENLFINKMNNYINISSDDGSIFSKKNEKPIFISPKLNNINKKNIFKKIAHYSINNNNNEKEIYYTDLKKGINNVKIKSTNYSSNMSYDNKDHKNNNKNKKDNISTLNKISIFNVNKNNKKVKKIKFHDSLLVDNKRKNKTDHNKGTRKIPMHRSTIQYCKTLKTIDEYMELKRNKSKSKNSQSKKRDNNPHTLSNNKRSLNKSNKKERKPRPKESKKSQKKLINYINIDNINNEDDTIKDNYKEQIDKKLNNNDDKKISPKMIKKNKSNPKITFSKSIFRSFLCCFGCSSYCNNDDIKSNCKNINKSPDDRVINTDINNKKLNDKKGKNKINKKKRNRKISCEK